MPKLATTGNFDCDKLGGKKGQCCSQGVRLYPEDHVAGFLMALSALATELWGKITAPPRTAELLPQSLRIDNLGEGGYVDG